jgi:hypothetical protein
MNLTGIPVGGDRLGHWTKIAAIVFLLLTGALAVDNRVELSRLAEANRASSQDAQLQVLAARVAELAQQVERVGQAPDAVPRARFESEREAVEQRFTAIEHALNDRPPAADPQPLLDRLTQLEERLAQSPPQPPPAPDVPPPRPPETPRPKPAVPPFQALGVESRAGERFVAILPAGANALAQVRLLRVGDRESGWRLESIEAGAAVFSRAGQRQRLNLTQSGKHP